MQAVLWALWRCVGEICLLCWVAHDWIWGLRSASIRHVLPSWVERLLMMEIKTSLTSVQHDCFWGGVIGEPESLGGCCGSWSVLLSLPLLSRLKHRSTCRAVRFRCEGALNSSITIRRWTSANALMWSEKPPEKFDSRSFSVFVRMCHKSVSALVYHWQ